MKKQKFVRRGPNGLPESMLGNLHDAYEIICGDFEAAVDANVIATVKAAKSACYRAIHYGNYNHKRLGKIMASSSNAIILQGNAAGLLAELSELTNDFTSNVAFEHEYAGNTYTFFYGDAFIEITHVAIWRGMSIDIGFCSWLEYTDATETVLCNNSGVYSRLARFAKVFKASFPKTFGHIN